MVDVVFHHTTEDGKTIDIPVANISHWEGTENGTLITMKHGGGTIEVAIDRDTLTKLINAQFTGDPPKYFASIKAHKERRGDPKTYSVNPDHVVWISEHASGWTVIATVNGTLKSSEKKAAINKKLYAALSER